MRDANEQRERLARCCDRFWSKVHVDAGDACWMWQGRRNSTGYGVFTVSPGWQTTAHRVSYQIASGCVVLAPADFVCHACDTPACVNPHHLWLGDIVSNSRDCFKKKRNAIGRAGQDNITAKLTLAEVREIRLRRSAGETPMALAMAYGVARPTVSNIVAGRFWRQADALDGMDAARALRCIV